MSAVIAPPAEHELPVHWAVAEPDNTQRRGVLGGVRLRIDTVCLVMVCMILIAVAFLAMMIVAIVKDWTQPASYSVAIDSVAGLDPETDLPRDTLNPEFNLTLRLASQRADMGVCFEAGTTVAVYYGGVLLAGAAVPASLRGPRPSAGRRASSRGGEGCPCHAWLGTASPGTCGAAARRSSTSRSRSKGTPTPSRGMSCCAAVR